jgi:hypothetical protein
MSWLLGAALMAVADGNIAQNSTETAGSALVPQVQAELQLEELPLGLAALGTWDAFQSQRELDDRQPLLQAEANLKLGSKHWPARVGLVGALHGGEGLWVGREESGAATIGLRTLELFVAPGWRHQRFELRLRCAGAAFDYGERAEGGLSGNSALFGKLEPSLEWNLRQKGHALALRKIAFEGGWRQGWAVDPLENEQRRELATELRGRAGPTRWALRTGRVFKEYAKPFEDRSLGTSQRVKVTTLNISPTLSLPLPAGVELSLQGEWSRRESRVRRYAFDDHRVALQLSWELRSDER